jgi:hypothetical protein
LKEEQGSFVVVPASRMKNPEEMDSTMVRARSAEKPPALLLLPLEPLLQAAVFRQDAEHPGPGSAARS